MQRITPFLWFDNQAEEAAKFYTSIFKKSKIGKISRYSEAAAAASGQKKGTVMTIAFKLDGQEFIAINGGPHFKFTEAVSLVVNCKTQKEVDWYWKKLTEGGAESQCGWLKDKFGFSWQVTPAIIGKLISDPATSQRVMEAVLRMKKPDIAVLKKAAKGK